MGATVAAQLARRRQRQRTATRAAAALVLVVALAAAALWWLNRPTPPSPDDAARELAAAWSAGDPAGGPVDAPDAVAETYPAVVEGLGAEPPDVELRALEELDGSATARFQVTWDLGEGHELTYPTTAAMEEGDDGWVVAFTPSVVHPALGADGRLVRRRVVPDRGDILGGDGEPLVTARPVVHVGVEPARVQDLADLTATLEALLDIDGAGLAARVEAASEHAFVPVITLRDEDYQPLADQLQPLPGTVFQADERPLAPTRQFARPLLGAAGDVTAELVEEHPERYAAGDLAGLSGIQRRFDEQLAGATGFEVVAVTEGSPAEVLYAHDAVPGTPVQLTLDAQVQLAAEEALAGVEHPSALVAIRVSDGHVLAVANGPGTGGVEIALGGRYAPGSTFKVVTTAALLETGLDPEAPVSCSPTATIDGRSFRNAEQSALGEVPFRTAFAQSCNTTFVGLSSTLADDALQRAGRRFGLGLDHDLGVGAYTGQVPENESAVDKAAATIGQGRNLASPLAMADVAATVARGRHLAPTLVLDPAPDGEPGGPAPEPLDPATADALRSLMRSVVTDGSGGAVAGVGGEPVHGKTGTAEYGDEVPPRTHAWFIAYQGDLAVSVLVAETPDGFGGRLAAPVAADFLARLQ